MDVRTKVETLMALANLQEGLMQLNKSHAVKIDTQICEKELKPTQSRTVSPRRFSLTGYFVVSCHDEECDESVNSTKLRPAGRQSHEP